MAFSHEILLEAWARSGGRCECHNERHGHEGRCGRSLLWNMRGSDSAVGAWSPVRRTTWGTARSVRGSRSRCAFTESSEVCSLSGSLLICKRVACTDARWHGWVTRIRTSRISFCPLFLTTWAYPPQAKLRMLRILGQR